MDKHKKSKIISKSLIVDVLILFISLIIFIVFYFFFHKPIKSVLFTSGIIILCLTLLLIIINLGLFRRRNNQAKEFADKKDCLYHLINIILSIAIMTSAVLI